MQFLRGPAGTLYGRNATGGAILINTIDPGNDWQGQVEATYARFNDYRGRAFVAGPLSETIGISLAGTAGSGFSVLATAMASLSPRAIRSR